MLHIILLFFLSTPVFSSVDTLGFIVRDQAELFSDHQLTEVVQLAKINQEAIIVNSVHNNHRAQKINLDGFNYWIALKDIVIVDYPKYEVNNSIDPDRLGIIKNYLFRLYAN
ncbi:MAG: hypothetical protein A2381_13690 [Bdellovibrionales bacterium RIFOXYB1_FULL_37_110]|nr:MAG: hypothetical protein A2417_05325 [Bdellovibrionales bacterium RIFOXYC1_FULL_37_79]OFZ56913.1 MAG: hypothetical protein A2381_13690 [Bdellovibrionales bacterium RIFOXYB1_FULL_37_110]OFZ62000.1 MAG: hypothetical protein A2577_19160 [Bdellovibrionales bacterium RIFOXYD1_FULL_36_51]